MTTKAPSKIKEAEDSDPLKKMYAIIEEMADIIPVTNDRYRLAYNLNKFYTGEAASLDEAVRASKVECKIDIDDLVKKIEEKYKSLNLS
jgi:hypothetical protein